ncbi:MAG: aspartate carbamoyltransferase [Lentisphaerae bacterium]|nr:MAG: aspartate carbamoyltransferase [Lentisphaerota bacterium]
MGFVDFQTFMELPDSKKCEIIQDYAVLYAQQFDRKDLDEYNRIADAARRLHKTREGADLMASLLRHRVALNFFVQPSSRTFLSFNVAESYLGMRRMSIRDVKISSISKGESLGDSVRTFLSYVDLIVMRHPESDAGAEAFWIANNSHRRLKINGEERPIPIISGGSGTQQHPTQALLDIYTLQKSFEKTGGIDGKKIMLVGDLKRGRTVRSLAYLMKNYEGVELYFAAPPEYQMKEDICQFLREHNIPYHVIGSIAEAIEEVDAVYMTRIQDEWDKNRNPDDPHVKASQNFVFTLELLKRMKPAACLMHPLPKRDEIDPQLDYIEDPRIVYWRQERNGMWMRVAIIAKLFHVHHLILEKAKELGPRESELKEHL